MIGAVRWSCSEPRRRGAQRRGRQPGPDQPLERPGHALAGDRHRRRCLCASCSARASRRSSSGCSSGRRPRRRLGRAAPAGPTSALLVASACVVPWYLIWLLPLAAVSRDRCARRWNDRAVGVPAFRTRCPWSERGSELTRVRRSGDRRGRRWSDGDARRGRDRRRRGGHGPARRRPGRRVDMRSSRESHFRRRDARPGSRPQGAGAALSDLAAMGAEPGEAYVVLGVPADFDGAGGARALRRPRRAAARGGARSSAATSPPRRRPRSRSPRRPRRARRASGRPRGARPGRVRLRDRRVGGAAAGLMLARACRAAPSGRPRRPSGRRAPAEPRPAARRRRALARGGRHGDDRRHRRARRRGRALAAASGAAIEIESAGSRSRPGVAEVAAPPERDAARARRLRRRGLRAACAVPRGLAEAARRWRRDGDRADRDRPGRPRCGVRLRLRRGCASRSRHDHPRFLLITLLSARLASRINAPCSPRVTSCSTTREALVRDLLASCSLFTYLAFRHQFRTPLRWDPGGP